MGILSVKNLSKIYGEKENQVKAIDNVSFEVEKGEFIAITGASGSGKSTLLHLIGVVDKPTHGEVRINGTDIYSLSEPEQAKFRRNEVALIYQFYNLIPVLNVEENINLPIKLDNREPNQKEVDDIIKKLGLEERRKNLPNQLSGGQQQRVAIGRSLIQRPTLLLADEPTGNLDKKNSVEIIELLKKVNKESKQTIILVTHDLEIARQASRVITISDGKVVNDGRLN